MMWLIIGLGGIAGSISRFSLGTWVSARSTSNFPFGTFLINITGSILLGYLAGMHSLHELGDFWYALLGTGFCGAYTTFSTFGVETIRLIEGRHWGKAIAYVIASVLLSLLGAWLGLSIAGS